MVTGPNTYGSTEVRWPQVGGQVFSGGHRWVKSHFSSVPIHPVQNRPGPWRASWRSCTWRSWLPMILSCEGSQWLSIIFYKNIEVCTQILWIIAASYAHVLLHSLLHRFSHERLFIDRILDLIIRWNVDLDCADSRFIASVRQWSALKHVTSQAVLKGWRSCKQSVGWFSIVVMTCCLKHTVTVEMTGARPHNPLQPCQHLALSPRCSHYSTCRTLKILLTCPKITTTQV